MLGRIPIAAVDRVEGVAVTMCGQLLDVIDWADQDGVISPRSADARYCLAGPDAAGRNWTIDLRRLERVDRR